MRMVFSFDLTVVTPAASRQVLRRVTKRPNRSASHQHAEPGAPAAPNRSGKGQEAAKNQERRKDGTRPSQHTLLCPAAEEVHPERVVSSKLAGKSDRVGQLKDGAGVKPRP